MGLPRALWWVLAVGAFVRFLLLPHPSFGTDWATFRAWGIELTTRPIATFYDHNPIDHLPGDLWIHWMLADTYQLFSPDFEDRAFPYEQLLKIPPGLADLGTAIVGFFLVRRWSSYRTAVGAAWFLALNPASLFISSVWGQWDSISAFVALLSLYTLLTRHWFLSFALLTYAVLIKPQLAALGPLFLLFIAIQHLLPLLASHGKLQGINHWFYPRGIPAPSETPNSLIEKSFLSMGGAVLVFAAVCLPFNVGFPPIGSHSVIDRVRAAVELYDATTMGAFNFWNTWLGDTISYEQTRISDSGDHWLGMTYRTLGTALTLAGYAACLMIFLIGWRTWRERMTLWASGAIMLTLFVLPTRIHERYFLPALIFMIVLAYVVPRFKMAAITLTVAGFFNLIYVFDVYYSFLGRSMFYDFMFDPWFVPTVSMVIVICYAALMARGFLFATEAPRRPVTRDTRLATERLADTALGTEANSGG